MPHQFSARTDSNSANNTGLNLTNADAITIEFVADGQDGDLALEPNGGAVDPDTSVVIDGVNYEFTFELSGTLPTSKSDGANQVPGQFEGASINVITVHDYPSAGETTRMVFMPEEDASNEDMDAFGKGAISLQDVNTTDTSAICFAAGTLIETTEGLKPIETLRIGDNVFTLDNGPQPVIWLSKTDLEWPGADPSLRPIAIRKNAFGPNAPMKETVLSPQHRVFLGAHETGGDAALAPARGLLDRKGIRLMRGKKAVSYYHLLLPKHEVVLANGLACESFYPGPEALKTLRKSQRSRLGAALQAAGVSSATEYGGYARRVLSVTQTRALYSGLVD
ncbi:Hint domain-containing protein [Cognatishimia sp. SS12]|uniref:Hint domain-containing protein n=1 Tax=Cognatishimia sp. SS12 TaxID=2979465 RepID=UPI00232DB884|nr:Hint domain-containing protein [Cognatishimia sp. SS12]MDC0736740.1 Hint domain-containing protein [Cognatishimia sp. SS12]